MMSVSKLLSSSLIKTARQLEKTLAVEWNDGLNAQFPFVWLRDNSSKRPSLIHLELNPQPEELDCNGHGVLIRWPPFLNSAYSSSFLREHARIRPVNSTTCPNTRKVLPVPWRIVDRDPCFSEQYTPIASTSWGDCATETGTVFPALSRVPSLVTAHTDLPDCKVTLVDAVQVMSDMSYLSPVEFNFLRSSFIEYRSGPFHALHPVLTIENNRISTVCFNNACRSPEITTPDVEAYYTSLKAFNKIACESAQIVTLQPSDLLIIDNSQTLLGAPAQNIRDLHVSVFD